MTTVLPDTLGDTLMWTLVPGLPRANDMGPRPPYPKWILQTVTPSETSGSTGSFPGLGNLGRKISSPKRSESREKRWLQPGVVTEGVNGWEVLPASLLYDYGNLFLQEVICGRKHSPEIKLNIPSPQKSGDSGGA